MGYDHNISIAVSITSFVYWPMQEVCTILCVYVHVYGCAVDRSLVAVDLLSGVCFQTLARSMHTHTHTLTLFHVHCYSALISILESKLLNFYPN